ncbi:hypothetical protein WN51_13952 [Melipona quadrifasciata]|uniref:Uncharacterized protein n=1 Tax=Melipona quadrifasciata TaxID=166423 RepID=A0A0N0U543_9HYME|nr:hypothetical protein WN51_13952 [Melipona quadrifasciata]
MNSIAFQSRISYVYAQAASGCAPSVEVLPISDVAANKAECGNTARMHGPSSLVGLVTTTSVWGKESLPSGPTEMSLGSDSETKRKTIAFFPTPLPYLTLPYPSVLPQHPSQLPLPSAFIHSIITLVPERSNQTITESLMKQIFNENSLSKRFIQIEGIYKDKNDEKNKRKERKKITIYKHRLKSTRNTKSHLSLSECNCAHLYLTTFYSMVLKMSNFRKHGISYSGNTQEKEIRYGIRTINYTCTQWPVQQQNKESHTRSKTKQNYSCHNSKVVLTRSQSTTMFESMIFEKKSVGTQTEEIQNSSTPKEAEISNNINPNEDMSYGELFKIVAEKIEQNRQLLFRLNNLCWKLRIQTILQQSSADTRVKRPLNNSRSRSARINLTSYRRNVLNVNHDARRSKRSKRSVESPSTTYETRMITNRLDQSRYSSSTSNMSPYAARNHHMNCSLNADAVHVS